MYRLSNWYLRPHPVRPGERFCRRCCYEGLSAVDESMLTGESKPVPKQAATKVIGGSVNGEGSLTVEVRKTGKESYLNQVIELVRLAQESKSRTQDLANRAAVILTFVAIIGGAITLAAWLLFSDQSFAFAIERAVTVMVIACPHALGLAVPLVVAVSTAIAATNGLLIRDRAAFERSRSIDAIIFDKTGTLTQGKFGVTDTFIFDPQFTRDDAFIGCCGRSSPEHPIAKGIVASTSIKNLFQVLKPASRKRGSRYGGRERNSCCKP